MKHFNFLFIILIGILTLSSCNDEGTSIPDQFTQKVVVEKFTGEWCGACVSAGRFYKDHMEDDRFIGVGIHAGGVDRYKDNEACKTVYSYLRSYLRDGVGGSVGFPNVMFDRSTNNNGKIVNGYNNTQWDSKYDEQLEREASCGLSIESSINSGVLTGKIKYVLKEELTNSPAITVYLIENNLDGSEQVNGNSSTTHSGVLRGLMTAKEGMDIDGVMTNSILEFEFEEVGVSAYDLENLEIVAFIHENGSDLTQRKILNGQKVKAGSKIGFE